MKGRIFDVVAFLTQRYGVDGGATEDPRDLCEELLHAGFEEDDVERALVWLRLLQRGGVPAAVWMCVPPDNLRVPTPEEAVKLSAEARGFLLQLERYGILTPAMREAVYEQALALDEPEIGAQEVRVLVALLLQASSLGDDGLVTRILDGDLGSLFH